MSLVREMLGPMVGALADRTVRLLESFALELEAERHRLICTMAWTCAAICSLALAIALAVLLAVLLLPRGLEIWLLGGLVVLFGVLGLIWCLRIRRQLKKEPIRVPFLSGVMAVGQVLSAVLERDSGS